MSKLQPWSYFPDGSFQVLVTRAVYHAHEDLLINWTSKNNGSHHKIGESAETEADCWKVNKSCLGVLECDQPNCAVMVLPGQRQKTTQARLQKCTDVLCPGTLQHHQCDASWSYRIWKYGVRLVILRGHSHDAPTRTARISPLAAKAARELILANNAATPAAIRAGNTASGESLAAIHPNFINGDYARHVIRTIRGPVKDSGDRFLQDLADYQAKHPQHFIKLTLDGGTQVISVQTRFMGDVLCDSSSSPDTLKGLVSDATYSFFQRPNSLLLTTSAYCGRLQKWVPVLYSYTNGATALHAEYHFYSLFKLFAHRRSARGEQVEDRDLPMVSYTFLVLVVLANSALIVGLGL